MRVGLFIPCYVDQLYPQVGRAAVRVLERLGVQCDFDPRQTCCGQPAFNSGYWPEAACVAEHFVRVFDQYEHIVAPGGSCVGMIRNHYRRLLGRDEPVTQRVHELCAFITDHLGVEDLGAALPGRAALHLPCHMLRGLLDGIEPVRGQRGLAPSRASLPPSKEACREVPVPFCYADGIESVRRLLSHVRGLEIVELQSDEHCCGFGGTFSVKFPHLSAAMAARKLKDMERHGVDYVISPESSCLMQLSGVAQRQDSSPASAVASAPRGRRGRPCASAPGRAFAPRLLHVAEVLADSRA